MKTFLTFLNYYTCSCKKYFYICEKSGFYFISRFVLLSAVIPFTADLQNARAENICADVVSTQTLRHTQMSVNDLPLVYVCEADEALLMEIKEYYVFNARTADSYIKVMFSTNTVVKNFKVLNLSDCQIDDNGKISFQEETLYEQPELLPECPIVVIMSLYGTIPNNGISYTDEHGTTHKFTVSINGKDNSVVINEYCK